MEIYEEKTVCRTFYEPKACNLRRLASIAQLGRPFHVMLLSNSTRSLSDAHEILLFLNRLRHLDDRFLFVQRVLYIIPGYPGIFLLWPIEQRCTGAPPELI